MDFIVIAVAGCLAFALGASIGSFINVVAYRLPAGISLLHPPSRCPHCLHKLDKRENVPIFGWLWLRGRCRHCRAPISSRYPIVEAAAGILFLLIFLAFYNNPLQMLGYWTFTSWLLALTLIDLDTMTLPNPLTQSGLVLGLAFQFIRGFAHQGSLAEGINYLMSGAIAAVLGIWLFDIIAFGGSVAFGKAAMGGGDAKLAAMMGAWLGWKYLLLAAFLGCALGAFVGGGAIALGWLNRQQPMPFGPFLALGSLITIFAGRAIIATYLQIFFPLNAGLW